MDLYSQLCSLESVAGDDVTLGHDGEPMETPRFLQERRALFKACFETASTTGGPVARKETWIFEPILLHYTGHTHDTFNYATGRYHENIKLAKQDEWGLFCRLLPRLGWKVPHFLHFLAARRWQGKRKDANPQPLVLINRHHTTGSFRELQERFSAISDPTQPGFDPFMYVEECEAENNKMWDALSDE